MIPHSKAKFTNSTLKLNLFPKVNFFAWKLARNILLIRDKLRYYGMIVVGECPFFNNEDETIDYIFIKCHLAYNI